MKANIFLLIAGLLFFDTTASAQVADGSIAPNFISTDIEGNEWELYEVLNQGKTVILDISATWCAPCWDYHQSGELETLYEMYGPDGTNELMVFLIEGDEMTTTDQLYGIGSGTLGDWVTGTHYPIIDDREIAEAFQINFFPTLFMICPTRKVYQAGQWTSNQIYNETNICPQALGDNNASILNYGGLEGQICEDVNFAPAILMQNMGAAPLTEATITLKRDNNLIQEIQWAGDLNTYDIDDITFDPILVTGDTELSIDIESVNGEMDDDDSNNNYIANIMVSEFADHELVTLELQLDNIPGDTYWEISNSDGDVIYYDGNQSAKDPGAGNEESYLSPNAFIEVELLLPSNGCYEFGIYDLFGDGLSGSAFYRLKKEDGSVLLEGGDFNFEETTPFGIVNAQGTSNNATLLYMQPLDDDFCFDYTFSPVIKFQNTGNNSITNLGLSVYGDNINYLDYEWAGDVSPANIKTVTLPEITVSSSNEIVIEIVSVNGQPHDFEFRNKVSRPSLRRATTEQDWVIDFYTGSNAHEIYWQLTDDNNNVIISGGNEVVGPDGAGLEVAQPGDSGAYADNSQIIENITLPSFGCYHLKLVDDIGNGLSGGGFGLPNPFFKIRNNTVGVIVETNGNYGEEFNSNIGIESSSANHEVLAEIYEFQIQPNPVSDELSLFLENINGVKTNVFIMEGLTGRIIYENELMINGGGASHRISTEQFASGVYMVGMRVNDNVVVKKFIVER